jgi:hypothetical protein
MASQSVANCQLRTSTAAQHNGARGEVSWRLTMRPAYQRGRSNPSRKCQQGHSGLTDEFPARTRKVLQPQLLAIRRRLLPLNHHYATRQKPSCTRLVLDRTPRPKPDTREALVCNLVRCPRREWHRSASHCAERYRSLEICSRWNTAQGGTACPIEETRSLHLANRQGDAMKELGRA